MSVADDYWRHYYMTPSGNLRRKKHNMIPKYLRRSRSSFTSRSSNSSLASTEPLGTSIRGWNRSAYFRFKANQGYINQLEKELIKVKKEPPTWSRSAPDSGYSLPRNIVSALKPLPKSLVRKRPQSERKGQPLDALSQLQHSIHGKVVIVTPQLIVTRQSPTPEENSPTEKTDLARFLEEGESEKASNKINSKVHQFAYF